MFAIIYKDVSRHKVKRESLIFHILPISKTMNTVDHAALEEQEKPATGNDLENNNNGSQILRYHFRVCSRTDLSLRHHGEAPARYTASKRALISRSIPGALDHPCHGHWHPPRQLRTIHSPQSPTRAIRWCQSANWYVTLLFLISSA